MKRATALIIATAIAGGGMASLEAEAQAAPGLSNSTYIAGQKLREARSEAVSTASFAEQREQSIAYQRAQLRLLEAQAFAAAQPRMSLSTGGSTPMSFSMPTGSGLLPGASGENNYHVNIQVGEGNSSSINTNTISTSEVISNRDDDTATSDDVE